MMVEREDGREVFFIKHRLRIRCIRPVRPAISDPGAASRQAAVTQTPHHLFHLFTPSAQDTLVSLEKHVIIISFFSLDQRQPGRK